MHLLEFLDVLKVYRDNTTHCNLDNYCKKQVSFVKIKKVFRFSATVVLLGLKQFHASVGYDYLCSRFEMLKMIESDVWGKCSMSNGNSGTKWSG